jgi:hypothetical protein
VAAYASAPALSRFKFSRTVTSRGEWFDDVDRSLLRSTDGTVHRYNLGVPWEGILVVLVCGVAAGVTAGSVGDGVVILVRGGRISCTQCST